MHGSRRFTFKEMFWNRIKIQSNGCWIWTGPKLKSDYGKFNWDRTDLYAHRYMYSISKGVIKPMYEIHHSCGNRSCVKPGHLIQVPKFNHPGKGFQKGNKIWKLSR